MENLLAGGAQFLLENIVALGVGKGKESFSEILSDKALEDADAKIREYLMSNLHEYEYNQIDSYLSKTGVYAHSQANTSWSIMSAETDRLIENFFNLHPDLQCDRERITPLLRRAIMTAYQSVINQLGTEGKVLYSHALQNKLEHQNITNQLSDLSVRLSQLSTKLSYAEVVKIFNMISNIIFSGNLSSGDLLIKLMEIQVDNRDKSYCTALKIFLSSFIDSREDVNVLCVQFVRENPVPELIAQVVTFLLQMKQKSALKLVLSTITDVALFTLANEYISNESSDKMQCIINDDGTLKNEYENMEAALWVFANMAKKSGNIMVALKTYHKIQQNNASFWLNWSIEECELLFATTNFLVNLSNNLDEIKERATRLLQFNDIFSQLCCDLRIEFINSFLSCVAVLNQEDFKAYYNRMNLNIKNMPQAQKYWYFANLTDWKNIDEDELKEFCEKYDDVGLWSTYLFHKVKDTPNDVLKYIEENRDLLSKEPYAIFAYYEAIACLKGKDDAYNAVTALPIPPNLAFGYNIFLAELSLEQKNDKASIYLDAAVDFALNASCGIPIIQLRHLISLLDNAGRWLDASKILEKYQNTNVAFMLLRLEILIAHEEQYDVCDELIKKLESVYNNDPSFMYCKGRVCERELLGSGMEWFEKAFRSHQNPRYAFSALASRVNRNVYIEDEILLYASNSDDVDLLHVCSMIYAKKGKTQNSVMLLLQGLVNCDDKYHEKIYNAFVAMKIQNDDSDIEPLKIGTETCCVLKNIETGESMKLWIHDESIKIPRQGSTFAGYKHLSPNSNIAFSVLEQKVGNIVTLSDGDYEVATIVSSNTIAVRYCMQSLLEHGVMQQFYFDESNPEAFFEEVKKINAGRGEHIQDVIEKYKSLNPGLTLELFAIAIGEPYYKTVYALVNDTSISFFAGSDGEVINNHCILTPSVIAILSALNIHPPAEYTGDIKWYVTLSLKAELDLQSREHRTDKTAAILGFTEDGSPYMRENTLESKRYINNYFACLNEWANWGETLASVLPNEYPLELKPFAHEVGIPNIEALVHAKSHNYLVCCDDLFLRRYLYSVGVMTSTTMDIVMALNYSYEEVLDIAAKLIEHDYVTSITPNFLKWMSSKFIDIDDKTFEQRVLIAIDLIKKTVKNNKARVYIIQAYKKILEEKTEIHPTLKWIISTTLHIEMALSIENNECD